MPWAIAPCVCSCRVRDRLVAIVDALMRRRGQGGERADAFPPRRGRPRSAPASPSTRASSRVPRARSPTHLRRPSSCQSMACVPGADQVGQDGDRVARAADAGEEARVVGALPARAGFRRTARRSPAADPPGPSLHQRDRSPDRSPGRSAQSAAGHPAAPSGRRAGPTRDGRGGAARRAEGSADPRTATIGRCAPR